MKHSLKDYKNDLSYWEELVLKGDLILVGPRPIV